MRRLSEIVRDQHPVTMDPDATVREACQRMHDQRFASVLVTDDRSSLLGIFTRADHRQRRVVAIGRFREG